jgi:glycosyltransferase involved in cell wall biosynthesis
VKISHFFGGPWSPGATGGARVLHRALKDLGVDSRAYSLGWDARLAEDEKPLATTNLDKLWERTSALLDKRRTSASQGLGSAFHSGRFGHHQAKHRQIAFQSDLLHYHWLTDGMGDITRLPFLGKPVVITARDQWLGTGGCHYSLSCNRFQQGCGACPLLADSTWPDPSANNLKRKRALMDSPQVTIVAPSAWLADTLASARVVPRERVAVIPNGIDFNQFPLIPRDTARDVLGLPRSRRLLAIVADQLDSPWKGVDTALKSLGALEDDFEVLLVGRGRVDGAKEGPPQRSLGYYHDPLSLALALNACDALLCPSAQEAFGKVVLEASACGTPSLALGGTGAGEVVRNLDGVVLPNLEPAALAAGLSRAWDQGASETRRKKLRFLAQKSYDGTVIAEQYLALYRRLCH